MPDGSAPTLIDLIAAHAEEFGGDLFGPVSQKDEKTIRFGPSRRIAFLKRARVFHFLGEEATVTLKSAVIRAGKANDEAGAIRFMIDWCRDRGLIDRPASQKPIVNHPCPACGASQIFKRKYEFYDENGELFGEKLRYECSRRPACKFKATPWSAELNGRTPPPYRLEEWYYSSVPEVNICEGEKCADALRLYSGKLATSVDNWTPRNTAFFRGFDVVIWPDADETGVKKYAETRDILSDVAASVSCCVSIDSFPTDAEKVDALRRFYNGGHDLADFINQTISIEELYRRHGSEFTF